MITADLMSRITLFAKVPENERASLAARAADLHLRKDEWLLVEGQTPGFYGLLEGHIDVLKVLGGRDIGSRPTVRATISARYRCCWALPRSPTSAPPSPAACSGSRGRSSCSW